ncbi:MAG: amylo-alpha-1,6-glucosidase [Proteobacteria bacterium]|nr:amylo-alpha-1,6-glucosidase [Pseudomonadota bacterium]MBU2261547.1 amylo-alpha-1,6-glucosidase [Pseudomonadota bacterium]
MIRIVCAQTPLPEMNREWLETDGRGGYASSTLENCHTRRYHCLLAANLRLPEGRYVLLSKLEDSLLVNGGEFFFSRHRYPGVVFPPGPSLLKEFSLGICPRFTYRAGDVSVEKTLLLVRDGGTLLVRYDFLSGPAPGVLRLKPFLAFRGYHELMHENPYLSGRAEVIENGFRIEPYGGMPPLFVRTSIPSRFTPSPCWYKRFEYAEEQERGFAWQEDLFLPGIVEAEIAAGGSLILTVSAGVPGGKPSIPGAKDSSPRGRETTKEGKAAGNAACGENPAALWETEAVRRQEELSEDQKLVDSFFAGQPEGAPADLPARPQTGATHDDKPLEDNQAGGFMGGDREIILALVRAGRQFLIATPSGRPAVIAGYPWFGSWGRDALISLPGLAFCTGRIAEGTAILTELGRHEREGILPNFFSADGKPSAYNTVDSSLWYFWAVQELLRITDDADLVRNRFWPVMKRIVGRFLAGTGFGIGADARGLLHAGQEGAALTWMDAVVGGVPVTPRHGYAVEINALWYNALSFMNQLAARFAEPEWSFADLIPLLGRSFQETFWIHEGDYLGDVFYDGKLDRAIRPNQLFAVSLPFSPLVLDLQARVVRTVREQLLTPCGLRTLSPADPAYRGRYRGNAAERDSAYHQGTVWPWLLGPFGEAALRVAADQEQEKEILRKYLRHFLQGHLSEAGIGSVSEVFDGDPPHRPGGCIAQAWSVAELTRLYYLLNKDHY